MTHLPPLHRFDQQPPAPKGWATRLAIWFAGGAVSSNGDAAVTQKILGRSRARAIWGGFLFLLGFFVVAVRLVEVMAVGADVDTAPRQLAARVAPMPARADIVDRNGAVLATTVACPSMFADALKVADPVGTAAKIMKVLPRMDHARLVQHLSSKNRKVWLERRLTPVQQQQIHELGLPGIGFDNEDCRIYPDGNLASHLLGYTDIENSGQAGLERQFDGVLRNGQTLRLSVDMRVQNLLHRELQASITEFQAIGGAGVIMDAHSGEVLALVSLPDFDPHARIDPKDDRMFNRVTKGAYELGSVFKIFNTALALESGKVRLSDEFDTAHPIRIGRFTIRDFHPVRFWMNVPGIFVESSNIGSIRMVQVVGRQEQQRFLTSLGMTRNTTLELPELAEIHPPRRWGEVESWTISFGHGIAVTPLHLAAGVAAMVNGGTTVDPTLLRRTEQAPVGTRVVSTKTSQSIRQLMRALVVDGQGLADAPGYLVGGKTGTADKPKAGGYAKSARISSFAGAFPMHDPRYVIFVTLDEPQASSRTFGYATGGWVAAPVVGRVVGQLGPMLGMAPFNPDDPMIVKALTLPVQPTTAETARARPPERSSPASVPSQAALDVGGATLASF
jgi:cell division protein FtsI (penicillin-binding protein 3)